MYKKEGTVVFKNGNWIDANKATCSLYSQTIHYGTGVFEGIRAYNTEDGVRVFKGKEHYERLLFSAKEMGIDVNYTVEELLKLTYALLEKNNLTDAYIRPLVYLGESMSIATFNESNLVLMAWEWGRYLGDSYLNVGTSPYERLNSKGFNVEAKVCGHYVNSTMATNFAKRNGFDEALLNDQEGFVAEGPGANFFFEKDGELFTPSRGNILNGITRQTVMELASELGVKVNEGKFLTEHVLEADGAFFTGTAAEVALIGTLDHKKFNLPEEDTIGFELARMYKRRVSENEYKYFSLV